MGAKPHRGRWLLIRPYKDFNLAVGGGLGWMKWFKNGVKKSLHFMQLFLHYILFGENLLVKLKYLYIEYPFISITRKQNSNQNVKVEKIVVLVKTFDHYHYKFQLFQLYCKTVKEFATEI